MFNTIKNMTAPLILAACLVVVSSTCLARNVYIGYDINGVRFGELNHYHKSVVMNNVKIGFQDNSVGLLSFGAETILAMSPSVDVYGGTFQRQEIQLLGVADYNFHRKWHAMFKAGAIGIMEKYKPNYSLSSFSHKGAYPISAVSLYWKAARSIDIGLTGYYQLTDGSLEHYMSLGFNYYLDRK